MSLNTILATTPLVSTNYILKATGTTIGNSLIWDNGTNVGIGNTNTSYTLDVSGTGRFTGALTAGTTGNLAIFGTSNTSDKYISITNSIGNFEIGNNSTQHYLQGNGALPITFLTNATERMRITSGGLVGIGTTSPLGTSGTEQTLHLSSGSANYTTLYVTNGANSVKAIVATQSSEGVGLFGMQSNHPALFVTNDTERMRITSTGTIISQGSNIVLGSNNNASYSSTSAYSLHIANAGAEGAVAQGQITFGEVTAYGINTTRIGAAITTYYSDTYSRLGLIFKTKNTADDAGPIERMRITSGGNLYFNQGSNSGYRVIIGATNGTRSVIITDPDAEGYAGGTTAMYVAKNTGTGRSINAAGTINASGADYAEYMVKSNSEIIFAKGDIIGVNNKGKLTDTFSDAISFVVKSTDPSYVGGDNWFTEVKPGKTEEQTDEEFAIIEAEWDVRYQAARLTIDRIAFSGQVPCNVTGANVGEYIIPIELENGKIGGQAITNPTFEQFKSAVGKVWKIMEDGRAWIKVIN